MAAKQQGRKKARDVKRKEIQIKHPLAKRKQKTQPQKLKKHQAHFKHRAKHSSTSKLKEPERICSPRCFANKFLRQIPEMRMEAKAKSLMKTLLTYVYAHVATKVETLGRRKNEPSNIRGSDMQTSVKEAISKELEKHSCKSRSTECA